MKRSSRTPFRILANLNAVEKSSREMTGGILHYGATHPSSVFSLFGIGATQLHPEGFAEWHPDGFIMAANKAETVNRMRRLGCRAAAYVNSEGPSDAPLPSVSIYCDNAAVARAAVDFFCGKKLSRLAFVGTLANDAWSVERRQEMSRLADERGIPCTIYSAPRGSRSNHRKELAALAQWLVALPKPCGIFVACDTRANDVLNACQSAGVSIPDQVLVLGVDNEEFICRQTIPTLSSIVLDFEHGGYLAAEALTELLTSGQQHLPRRTFGVRGIIERMSTSGTTGSASCVGKAEEFIREYATTDVSVADVARAAGVSLRVLQKQFRTVTGKTVCDALQNVRLENVKRLLVETETPIGSIGEMCGFSCDTYLKKLFRERFGCSMRDWRAARRPAPFR